MCITTFLKRCIKSRSRSERTFSLVVQFFVLFLNMINGNACTTEIFNWLRDLDDMWYEISPSNVEKKMSVYQTFLCWSSMTPYIFYLKSIFLTFSFLKLCRTNLQSEVHVFPWYWKLFIVISMLLNWKHYSLLNHLQKWYISDT